MAENDRHISDLITSLARFNDAVDHSGMPLLRALKNVSQSPELKQELDAQLNRLDENLQIISVNLPEGEDFTNPTIQAKQANSFEATSIPQPDHLEERKSDTKAQKLKRRRHSNGLDGLLLIALENQERFGYPIGQDQLMDLAVAFDTNIKRASLVAKLNRWKNDKNWVAWSRPDDISITPGGRAERRRLVPLILRDKEGASVEAAFQQVWKREIKID